MVARITEYQRIRRARPGIQETEARLKAINRILAGGVPRQSTLDKWGLSHADVNKLRTDKGLDPIDFSLRPTRCTRASPCVQVSDDSVVVDQEPLPESPDPEQLPRPSGKILGKSASLQDVLRSIEGIRGKQQLLPSGRPAKNKDGSAKKLADSTVKQYADGMRIIAHTVGCADKDNFIACLKDTEKVLGKLRERYPKKVSLKKALGVIVSVAKYIPDFKKVLGAEAHDFYRNEMIGSIKAAEKDAVERTESDSAIPIDTIKVKLKDIANKFGKASEKYLEAKLQVELTGIRDDLGNITIVESERKAKQTGVDNYYVPRTRKLVIKKFKTSKEHPPYEFTLNAANAKLISDSLRKNRRTTLFPMRVGRRVTKTFADAGLPGVGVNSIRHSWITKLLGNNPSEANVNRIAAKFKHSPTMTLRYFRNGEQSND